MLYEAKLPASFWGEALAAYIHIWNQSPTQALTNQTPFQAWFSTKPFVEHLRIWGCLAYIQKDQQQGLEPHTQKYVFIGYPSGVKGWKFWNPVTKKCVISNDAEFDKQNLPRLHT